MPIYEYRCSACGHEFEVIQKLSDRPVRKCEACGKARAQRQISQTSFLLKGTGWYVTDYSGKGGDRSKGETSQETTPSKPAVAEAKPAVAKPKTANA